MKQQNMQLLLADVEGRQSHIESIPASEKEDKTGGQAGSKMESSHDVSEGEQNSRSQHQADNAIEGAAGKAAKTGVPQETCLSCDAIAAVTPGWMDVLDVVEHLVRGKLASVLLLVAIECDKNGTFQGATLCDHGLRYSTSPLWLSPCLVVVGMYPLLTLPRCQWRFLNPKPNRAVFPTL